MPVDYENNLRELKDKLQEIKYFVYSGIPYYLKLMELKQQNDSRWIVLFKNFYKIQGLTTRQRDDFFVYFQNVLFNHQAKNKINLQEIIQYCRENIVKNREDLSFISKLLHTYRPDKFIIYDKFVHKFFNPTGYAGKTELYQMLSEAYGNDDMNEVERCFDEEFTKNTDISSLKKIDFMIWGWGKWKDFSGKYQMNQ